MTFTQAPLQSSSPGPVQPVTHWPLVHAAPGAQVMPQPPQLPGSVRGSTQLLPQLSWPTGQVDTQRPEEQMALPPHTVVQPPQWKRSFCRSTQPVPQVDSGGVHAATQVPCEQTAPPGQPTPHAPQFAASARVSVHWPLQFERGALQLQPPEMHSSRASHAVPHAPQLRRSAETSMHRPPQNDCPLGQLCEQVPA